MLKTQLYGKSLSFLQYLKCRFRTIFLTKVQLFRRTKSVLFKLFLFKNLKTINNTGFETSFYFTSMLEIRCFGISDLP